MTEEDSRSALRAVRELRVSIPAAMELQLRAAAERQKVSVSEYARRALQRALQHDEQRSNMSGDERPLEECTARKPP